MIPIRSRLESILLLARGTGSPGTLPFFASFRDGGITTKLASGGGELQGLYRFPRSGDAGISYYYYAGRGNSRYSTVFRVVPGTEEDYYQ